MAIGNTIGHADGNGNDTLVTSTACPADVSDVHASVWPCCTNVPKAGRAADQPSVGGTGSMPARCASRTRAASVRACIFCMTRARWTLIVCSIVPRSAAICLLSLPDRTCARTSRSRGVSVANRRRMSAISSRVEKALRTAGSHCAGQRAGRRRCGFGQEVDRAPLHRPHARGDVAVSREKDDRQHAARSASACCICRPSKPGIARSRITQPAASRSYRSRNSRAEANARP